MTRALIATFSLGLVLGLAGCSKDDGCPAGTCRLPDGTCESGLDTQGDGLCDRSAADWSRDAKLPAEGNRADIYKLGSALTKVRTDGLQHSLVWPVTVSGVLLPSRPVENLFAENATDSKVLELQGIARKSLGFGTLPEMYTWLGLPTADGTEAQPGVPWPSWVKPGQYLGVGNIDTELGRAMTFSCATCHTANLFGKTVAGLTNRKARANEFFHMASSFFPGMEPEFFAETTGADDQELRRFIQTQDHFGAVGSKVPETAGLDTSLAQVALSLSRREPDAWATRSKALEASPRANELDTFIADSKPAVWWNLKYKTRWLSDGSIVSGNPIFTNFLWNELGRGTDLDPLEKWLRDNQKVADELTAAAFATPAPRWEDFFGADSIDEAAAKRGEAKFQALCASCHGSYEKGWSATDASSLSAAQRLKTTRVRYHEQTPVMNVGTSPQRAAGMAAFAERLNELAVSKWMKTVVEVQSGYVPPPLEGIWARYPYLHNQSVPTLCDLLSPAESRTKVFWMGDDKNAATDYDSACVGLPVGEAVPAAWKEEARRQFDTSKPGLSNQGHDAWLKDSEGKALLGASERKDLIEYLKTL
jgi:mono/diheme cytochrome c family protein